MKNRESRRSSKTNVDYDLVRKKLNQGNLQVQHEEVKTQKKGPTKSQINRLKNYIIPQDGYQLLLLLHTSESLLLKIMVMEI